MNMHLETNYLQSGKNHEYIKEHRKLLGFVVFKLGIFYKYVFKCVLEYNVFLLSS